ncbi:cell division protein FtsX [Yoonia sp. SS1-5]|uniref:Cell division protein FtsX n=1 Tax=Yoonia rhodophyticola TaxID=3137370 RepID=A0ABZ3JD44_9RHOB
MKGALDLLMGDPQADRVVPPTGITARMVIFVAGAMAFLAVISLALGGTAGRVADRWADELAQAATLRLPAQTSADELDRVLQILAQTPGIADARVLDDAEQQALLSPWLGADMSLDALPVPQLVEVVATDDGYDPDGLRARLAAEMPQAVLDDHGRWTEPLTSAARRLRWLGATVTLLIGAAMAATITLAAQAALAANTPVIKVLRLVGARDIYIARAFVRRFTVRSAAGAAGGSILGVLALTLMPGAGQVGGFMTDVGYAGASWVWPFAVPVLAAIVSFLATRHAALTKLREQS